VLCQFSSFVQVYSYDLYRILIIILQIFKDTYACNCFIWVFFSRFDTLKVTLKTLNRIMHKL